MLCWMRGWQMIALRPSQPDRPHLTDLLMFFQTSEHFTLSNTKGRFMAWVLKRNTVSKSKGTQCLHQNWTKHAWESRSRRSPQNKRARGCRRQTYRTTSHWTGESRHIFPQVWKGKGAHSSLSFNFLLEFLARAIKQEKDITEISRINLTNCSSTLETTETLPEPWRSNKHGQQSSKMQKKLSFHSEIKYSLGKSEK